MISIFISEIPWNTSHGSPHPTACVKEPKCEPVYVNTWHTRSSTDENKGHPSDKILSILGHVSHAGNDGDKTCYLSRN